MCPDSQNDHMIRKFLIVGLENSGKTSIILSLTGERNLLSFYSLTPTQGLNVSDYVVDNKEFLFWELGGQIKYRRKYLQNFQIYRNNVEKMFYIIDIQDKSRYEENIEYFKNIIQKFIEENFYPKILIFLHKFDPNIENKPEFSKVQIKSKILDKILSIIPPNFSTEVFRTTIYTVFSKKLL